jgi:hypothetical protein
MIQHTFTTHPNNAMNKIAELRKEGWTIVATGNTSKPSTEPDAHGVSYGGPEFSILAERKHPIEKFDPEWGPGGKPTPLHP